MYQGLIELQQFCQIKSLFLSSHLFNGNETEECYCGTQKYTYIPKYVYGTEQILLNSVIKLFYHTESSRVG